MPETTGTDYPSFSYDTLPGILSDSSYPQLPPEAAPLLFPYPVDAEALTRIPVYSENPECHDSQAFFGTHGSSLHSQSHCFRHSQNTRIQNR